MFKETRFVNRNKMPVVRRILPIFRKAMWLTNAHGEKIGFVIKDGSGVTYMGAKASNDYVTHALHSIGAYERLDRGEYRSTLEAVAEFRHFCHENIRRIP